MKGINLLKNIVYIVSSILAVPMVFLLMLRYSNTNDDEKFESVPLNTSIASLEDEWGTPDRIVNDGRVVYFYNTDFLEWEQYVFVFEKNKLTLKTIDD